MPSSSYGSSFSENVNIIGNQIQINESDDFDSNQSDANNRHILDASSDLAVINSKFSLKFSEKDLKE